MSARIWLATFLMVGLGAPLCAAQVPSGTIVGLSKVTRVVDI